jgi:hypothetical protein
VTRSLRGAARRRSGGVGNGWRWPEKKNARGGKPCETTRMGSCNVDALVVKNRSKWRYGPLERREPVPESYVLVMNRDQQSPMNDDHIAIRSIFHNAVAESEVPSRKVDR